MSLPIEANRALQAGVAIINPKLIADSTREVFMLNLPLRALISGVEYAHLRNGQRQTF